jgi:hypothetical protein
LRVSSLVNCFAMLLNVWYCARYEANSCLKPAAFVSLGAMSGFCPVMPSNMMYTAARAKRGSCETFCPSHWIDVSNWS